MTPVKSPPLTRPAYLVLVALAAGERHGYAVMSFVDHISDGAIRLSPGTLYRTIARLVADGLVEETGGGDPSAPHDARRRYYRLTTPGRGAAERETAVLARLVRAAERAGVASRATA